MRDLKVNNDGFTEVTGFFFPLIKGTLIGIIAIILFSLIPAIVVKYSWFDISNIKVISIIILFSGSFIGAHQSSRRFGRNGMLLGVVTGLVILLIIILSGLLFQRVSFEIIDLSLFLIKSFGVMLSGAFGGIIGINIKS